MRNGGEKMSAATSFLDSEASRTSAAAGRLLSVVVPAYNESAVLSAFHQRLASVLAGIDMDAEIVFVNDGSTDNTLDVINALRKIDPRICILDLSRNFGKEIAMTAGLDHATGDAVIVIDADLQDPPELIPELIEHWQNDYDIVYARRISREGETLLKKATAHAFYRVIQRMTRVHIPQDTGDFRLLSRRAVEAVKQLREQHRFMKGLFAWIGYPQKEVEYRRDPRFAGETKWNYWRLWNFALEGITSFSIAPLKVATYLGILVAMAAFAYAGYMLFDTLLYGNPVKGYPSLIVIILFLGGVQLVTLGIIGEYLGRIFNEAKNRPLYFVNHYAPGNVCQGPVGVAPATLDGQQTKQGNHAVELRNLGWRHPDPSRAVSQKPSPMV
jgi:polyisoprenyl-phosphate glycosyltransferase